jgi:hypothetical protein
MGRFVLALCLSLPLFGQLPAGVTRIHYSDSPAVVRETVYLTATADNVLWGASAPLSTQRGIIDRVDLAGGSQYIALPMRASARGITVASDGTVWVALAASIARVDPATNKLQSFNYAVARFISAGPDGNLWFEQNGSVVRLRPDGVLLTSTWVTSSAVTGAAFGTDGAFYLSADKKLLRVTAAGERSEFVTNVPGGLLYAGTGFLWLSGTKYEAIWAPRFAPPAEVMKLSYSGAVIGTYRAGMLPKASDTLGNLWLRSSTKENDVIGQLSPSGVLTRWALPLLPTDNCRDRWYGGMTALADGRVAVADYYPGVAYTPETYCPPRPADMQDTITILDPRIATVLSSEQLNPARRRTSRH